MGMKKLPVEVGWEISDLLDAKSNGKLHLTCKRLAKCLPYDAMYFFLKSFQKQEIADGEFEAVDKEEFKLKAKALFQDAENYLDVQIGKGGLRIDLGMIEVGLILIRRMALVLADLTALHQDNEFEKQYIKGKVQKFL